MKIKQIALKTANNFVAEYHRHSIPTVGHKFSIGCYLKDTLIGVAIVGRPVARLLDSGHTLEVLRLCTDGTKNASSKLYSACARIAKELGYDKVITYILDSESGTSLRASGWMCEDKNCGGGSWNVPSRPRELFTTDLIEIKQKYKTTKKQRWSKTFSAN